VNRSIAFALGLPPPGRWGTRFHATFPDGIEETVRVDEDVSEETTTPPISSPAPNDTPVAEDVGTRLPPPYRPRRSEAGDGDDHHADRDRRHTGPLT
jgi:hypothetical protein